MLKLDFSRSAAKFLQKMPAKHVRQVAERIAALQQSPSEVLTEDLKGYAPFRKLKSGEYRVVYFIENDTLFVTLVGKRNDDDIYKQLAKLKR
jgi:mRNA interferase RelE/StbE